jgi:hypothetical protein
VVIVPQTAPAPELVHGPEESGAAWRIIFIRVPPVSDDWRLRVHLPEPGQGRQLAENLTAGELEHELEQALADRAAVSHDEDDVFVYAATRQDAERATELARSVASQRGWEIETELARWHAESEQWESPDRPLPSTSDELAAEHAERIEHEREESRQQGYPEFEVRVQCSSRAQAVEFQAHLRVEGIPSLRRWRYVLVGAPDEDAATALAQRISSEAPGGAVVSTEGTGRAANELVPGNPFALFGGLGG